MDSQLAAVPWTSEWKLDSVRLRAEWRKHVTTPPEARQRAAIECLDIVDQAIVSHASLTLQGLRAQCAATVNRYDIVVEALWTVGSGTYRRASAGNAEQKAAARRTLELIITALDKNIPPDALSARRDEVVKSLRDRINRLE
jgi:hypothetical protein